MEFIQEMLSEIEELKPSIAIDFDGVLHVDSEDHHITDQVVKGAKEAVDQLKDQFKIIIYSARIRPENNIEQGMAEIKQFLNQADIYFDDISICKPVARFYIDDRAIRFITWKDALEDINKFQKNAAGSLTHKRRDQHDMTHTEHDPSIDEPTLDDNNELEHGYDPQLVPQASLEALWT